jgi:hypothetical protein
MTSVNICGKYLMVRWLYILGSCAILAASAVFGLWLSERGRGDPSLTELHKRPDAIDILKAQGNQSGLGSPERLPLAIEAGAFARHLNPPKMPEKRVLPVSAPVVNPIPSASSVRPVAPSVRFKLHATSYYPNEPNRSIALVSDVGSPEEDQRWVKKGARLGHFVIHEIRRGMIVYRDGEQLREMAVERRTELPRIVRSTRPGSRTVSAATDVVEPVLPTPGKPDGIDTGGN